MAILLCMGLVLQLLLTPNPRSVDVSDYGLTARVDIDMLNRGLLLSLAAMLVQGIEKRRPSARKLVCLIEVFTPSLERLIVNHRAAVAFHRGVVCGD